MKIYEDPPQPGVGVGRMCPVTPAVKAVSFAGTTGSSTKTPRRGYPMDGIKTPLRNGNFQSPGRTPKIQKPKMTVGSFRQSLKTPPPPRQRIPLGRSVLDDFEDKENKHIGSGTRPPHSKNLDVTSKPVATAATTTTNTTTATTYTGHIRNLTTPTVALRRSLRATVQGGDGMSNSRTDTNQEHEQKPPITTVSNLQLVPTRRTLLEGSRLGGGSRITTKSKSALLTTGIGVSKLGPPQRVAPKTPNSLLRTEMEVLSSSSSVGTDNDDSLLLSPPPGALWNALNLTGSTGTSTTGLVIVSPQAAASLHSWSSSRKKRQSMEEINTSPHILRTKDSDVHCNVSPNVPRTLDRSSSPSAKKYSGQIENDPLDDTNTNCVSTKNITPRIVENENVEKFSKGGVAMDLTKMFSPDEKQETQRELPRQNLSATTTPLAASVPPSLLSKLNANRQLTAPRDSYKNESSRNQQQKKKKMEAPVYRATKPKNRVTNIGAHDKPTKLANAPTEFSISGHRIDMASVQPMTIPTNETSKPRVPLVNMEQVQDPEAIYDVHPKRSLAFDVYFPAAERKLEKAVPKKETMESTTKPITDDWASKQCESFTAWLNYTFNPEEDGFLEGTTSVSGLRGLLIHRRLAQVRSKAKELFHGEKMRSSRMILLREISGGRLAIREDRDVTADIHLRKQLSALLLSYTTPWLRMGLEVMFDEIIEPAPITAKGPKTYLGRMKVALEAFIKVRFLSDESTLSKFTKGRCNVPSGIFEKRYKAQMRCLVLSRLMILVFFLDMAKSENLLDKVPRLFAVSSEVKSSGDILAAICRACLSAEGDVVKHLSRIGLKVVYRQDPVDEVNFEILNLATDLRDGVLLTRLSEIVAESPFKATMKALRLPAVSRLQKKFNVELALSKFRDHGVVIPDFINAHHIMDGHREMVLALMWCIISHCCITKLLKKEMVEQEIHDVIRSSKARSRVACRSVSLPNYTTTKYQKSLEDPNASAEQVLKKLLLRWSKAVCGSFGLQIRDWTTSFADGRAFCLLIHYYHPALLPLNEISSSSGHGAEVNIILSSDVILESERSNWLKASKAIKELGGIPAMLPCADTNSPPDEHSMLLCLSYLCSRLMESSKEIFATILIQAHYRRYQRRLLLERKMAASKRIILFWIAHRQNYFRAQRCRYARAVAKLEGFILCHKSALRRMRDSRLEKERQNYAANQIQRVFRGLLGREISFFLWEQRQATILLQKCARRFLAVRHSHYLILRRKAAISLQALARGFTARVSYNHAKTHATTIQRLVRGLLTRRFLVTMDTAALIIQKTWWSFVSRQNQEYASQLIQKMWRGAVDRRKVVCLRKIHFAACSIQKAWRGFYQRITYFILAESALLLQRVIRGFLSRQVASFHKSQRSATAIQKLWRGFSQQVQFQMDVMDITCVQGVVRRYLALRLRNELLHAVLVIQGAVRCALSRQRLCKRRSARKIQTLWRCYSSRTRFLLCKFAVITIQCTWRGHSLRNDIERITFAAIVIQSNWRRYWVYSDYIMFLKETSSAVIIQALIRKAHAKKKFDEHVFAVTTIQRRWKMRMELLRCNEAVTVVQKAWRAHFTRERFMRLRTSAVAIQSWFRVIEAKKKAESNRRNKAAISLQRTWRGFLQQVRFQLEILDIVCIQSCARRYLTRKRYIAQCCGACVVQRFFRCTAARKQFVLRKMARSSLLNHSAVAIQTRFRGISTRLKFSRLLEASVTVQKIWRGYLIRCAMWNLSSAARQIQCNWRRYSSRCSFLLLLLHFRSAVLIQSAIRMRITVLMLRRQQEAAVSLQCLFRCKKATRHLSQLVEFKRIREKQSFAALTIQALARGILSRVALARMNENAVRIQCMWRCYVAQNSYLLGLLEFKSAVVIQATFRMFIQRDDFMVVKYAAHTIQRYTRGLLTRMEVAVKHFAASEIQRVWRGYSTYSFESILRAVVKIQSLFRMEFARRAFEEMRILYWADLCYRQRKALVIQYAYKRFQWRKRLHAAAEVIQKTYRFYSQLKRIQLLSKGMTLFQSLFRGWQVRKIRTKKMVQLAQRIHKECVRAKHNPDLRLGNRTDRALHILQTSQSLTKIMDAVKELEASTRLSVVCCQVFTKANAANILLQLIQSCNRSVPHMELKEHILLTLENVSRYSSLVSSIAHYKYAEVFLDNVQVFRDKDGIFCLAVSLLHRIALANPYVVQYCSSHEHLKRLKEVFRVVSRRMDPRKTRVAFEFEPQNDTMKKRVDFNRDYSINLLGQMIQNFSALDALPVSEENSKFRFDF
ncbi:IQ calmodulin-binding motif-containing protein [Nitzschia inconspicua]|uniref:IQ calmodulin-binding motif-containing protein n=1 Tax=Nitzschia inconspicua TaxID=303405 RepID=A0A9K3LIA8_9STRA|nr:IQ calmodulin-binding motif-containing protein [Nitzschia inconspicua]